MKNQLNWETSGIPSIDREVKEHSQSGKYDKKKIKKKKTPLTTDVTAATQDQNPDGKKEEIVSSTQAALLGESKRKKKKKKVEGKTFPDWKIQKRAEMIFSTIKIIFLQEEKNLVFVVKETSQSQALWPPG